MSFIPDDIKERLKNENFSNKTIEIIEPICGRVNARILWPKGMIPEDDEKRKGTTGGKKKRTGNNSFSRYGGNDGSGNNSVVLNVEKKFDETRVGKIPEEKVSMQKFALYILHISQIINSTYLNLAHFLSKRVDCTRELRRAIENDERVEKNLPVIDIAIFHLNHPKVFRLGEEFPTVNGGYTVFGDQIRIVVFRQEEMGRVLVHEMIHAFEYDVMHNREKISPPYKSCDDSKININETITDFAANVMISKISGFLTYTHERIWSYVQAARVTKLLGYNSVMDVFSTEKCIAEKTSLIAYYILKSAILHTYRTKAYRKYMKPDKQVPNSAETKKPIVDLRTDDNTTANLLVFIRKFRKEPGDKNQLRELSNLIGKKFSDRERKPKDYSFEKLISAAIRDPEWQMEVDRRISHPKLFKNGIATARMSISEYLVDSGKKKLISEEKFYDDGIYDL